MTTVLAYLAASLLVVTAVVLHWLLCSAEGRQLRQALRRIGDLESERDEWKALALRRVDELAAHRAEHNRREVEA